MRWIFAKKIESVIKYCFFLIEKILKTYCDVQFYQTTLFRYSTKPRLKGVDNPLRLNNSVENFHSQNYIFPRYCVQT